MNSIKYQPRYQPNQLILGERDDLCIVCGWSVKESILKIIPKTDFAVLGNLYSNSEGISYLIRNLWLNPAINKVLLLSFTTEDETAGSVQLFYDFLKNGVSWMGKSKHWEIISEKYPNKGYIDREIDYDALEELRNSIYSKLLTDKSLLTNTVHDIIHRQYYSSTKREAIAFPEKPIEVSMRAGNIYSHTISGCTIADGWLLLLKFILEKGIKRNTGYDGFILEVINLNVVINNEPIPNYFPDPNYLPIDRKYLANYIPQILADAPYREGIKYTYGQRLRSWFGKDQIEQVINKLINEIDAASAVMSLWDVNDHEKGGSPCLNHIWVRVVNDELLLTALFRSNDMFSAWVANAMGLRNLQSYIRDEINKRSEYNLKLGSLTTISQSAHIYNHAINSAKEIVEKHKPNSHEQWDNIGNFVIEYTKAKIIATQRDKITGVLINEYSGSPRKIIKEILVNDPDIDKAHLAYLAAELTRCSYEKEQYHQF